MTDLAHRRATYADVLAAPPDMVAEIIDGALVTHPRPRPRHAVAHSALGTEISDPYQRGRGGPGGWVFLTEPELSLGAHLVVPDIAGWRRERLTELPETNWIETPPDWVCEIISPSTEYYDRTAKRRIYGEAGVAHLWLLDPDAQLLEAFGLVEGRWLLNGTAAGDEQVSLEPFDAISFPLMSLFPFDRPRTGGDPHHDTRKPDEPAGD